MEMFKNKFFVKLIIAILLVVTLLSFATPNKVHATTEGNDEVWGGVLINPIVKLMTGIGDAIMEILHDSVQSQDVAIIKIDGHEEWYERIAGYLALAAAILFAIGFVTLIGFASAKIAAWGVALSLTKAATVKISTGLLTTGVISGCLFGIGIKEKMIPDNIYLPAFSISAEQIFKDEIYLFDVNFFNPGKYTIKETDYGSEKNIDIDAVDDNGDKYYLNGNSSAFKFYDNYNGNVYELGLYIPVTTIKNFDNAYRLIEIVNKSDYFQEQGLKVHDTYNYKMERVNAINNWFYIYIYDGYNLKFTIEYQPVGIPSKQMIYVTIKGQPEKEIASILKSDEHIRVDKLYEDIRLEHVFVPIGKLSALGDDAKDFRTMLDQARKNGYNIDDTKDSFKISYDMEEGITTVDIYERSEEGYKFKFSLKFQPSNTTAPLRVETFSKTNEVAIDSIAQQLRGIISTWYYILRNFALLVLMLILIYSGIRIVIGSTAGEKAKYKERIMDWLVAMCLVMIMHYIMVFAVELVSKFVDLIATTDNGNVAYIQLTDTQRKNAEEVLKGYSTDGASIEGDKIPGDAFDDSPNGGANGSLIWPTDLAGLFRIQSQLTEVGTVSWVGYSLCYVVLVLFTLFFAFTYARRVVYMAFLTLIAPLVAMTYPIDKITDGKAQAFNTWLKEYIFNLMIQPLHLLLYTILVTSAFQLASESAIYALVAIGFMMPAEKLLRSFFGFEKAKTPGLLGGAAGAAIAMTGLQNLFKGGSKGGKSGGGNASANAKDQNKAKVKASTSIDTLEGILGGNNESTPSAEESKNKIKASLADYKAGKYPNKGMPSAEQSKDKIKSSLADYKAGKYTNKGIPSAEESKNKIKESLATYNANKNNTDKNSENKKTPTKPQRTWRAIKSATGSVGKQVAGNVLTGVHPMRFAGKLAAGATGATAGMLLGVASGDPNKTFQYTTAGAMAGSSFASSLSGREAIDSNQLKSEWDMAYWGEDYRQHLLDERREEFVENDANIRYLRETLSLKDDAEAQRILDSTGVACFNEGIEDIEDIATIYKLTETGKAEERMDFKEAVSASKYAKRIPSNVDTMTDKKRDEYVKTFTREFRADGRFDKPEDAGETAMKKAIKFSKTRDKLNKLS